MESAMIVKFMWPACGQFVVEDEDAFFVEASVEETKALLYPLLSQRERIKFDSLKDVYQAKSTTDSVCEGCYYFLVSRGAHELKFESSALPTSDVAKQGGGIRRIPDITVARIEDISAIDPAAY
jgi:hypothetical protein